MHSSGDLRSAGKNAGKRRLISIKRIDYALRWCPAGEFLMGSPPSEEGHDDDETQHRVKLTKGFWMLETPVTQSMWESVMGTSLQEQGDKGDKGWPYVGVGPTHPMYYVSWEEATEFCRKLSLLANTGTFSLPTEAQWEYACRAGTTTALYTGGVDVLGACNAPALDPIAWYSGNSSVGYQGEGVDSSDWPKQQYSGSPSGAHPVGEKKPNTWGLYDMIGNVWEWCQDWYGDYPSDSVTDPTGPKSGSCRVIRGGSWFINAKFCRCAIRLKCVPYFWNLSLGFRVLLVQ